MLLMGTKMDQPCYQLLQLLGLQQTPENFQGLDNGMASTAANGTNPKPA